MVADDVHFMRLALSLAARGQGRTRPNPMVGAVLVQKGRVIAKAYHRKAGTPHAEALALQEAGPRARGATLYVNLEPCCHTEKRTPPCSHEILRAGVKRVVVAMMDPNPRVAGRGLSLLSEGGVSVVQDLLSEQARKLNEVYAKYITTGRPFVILKIAASLDGKIATATGESRWITGESARKKVHRIRSFVDAVMVGKGTVLQDDPLLTVRGETARARQPLRIVVDSRLRIPTGAKVLEVTAAPTLVVTTAGAPARKIRALQNRGVEVMVQGYKSGKVNLDGLISALGKRGIASVLVEGGSELSASMLKERLADKVIFFLAPRIIGGTDAISAVGGLSPKRLDLSIHFKDLQVRKVGEDLMVEGYLGPQR